MKILIVVHSFLPRHVGGTEIHTDQLARRLAETGNDVAIFTREDVPARTRPRMKSRKLAGRLWLHELFYSYFPVFPSGPSRFLRSFNDRVVAREFSLLLDRFDPDIVHIQHLAGLSLSPLLLALGRGIPVAATLNDFWFICPSIKMLSRSGKPCGGPEAGKACAACAGLADRVPSALPVPRFTALLNKPLQKYRFKHFTSALNLVDAIVTPSNFLGNMFSANGINREIMRVIPYGISVPREALSAEGKPGQGKSSDTEVSSGSMDPDGRPTAGGGPGAGDGFVFGYIGSIIPAKGVHLLVDAWEEATRPGTELRIYGDPEVDPGYFADLTRKPGWRRIDFRGPLPRKDLDAALGGINILAAPSLWYENSPLVIQEALSRGVPVIVPGHGGAAELAPEDRGGAHFAPGDARDLRRVMLRVSNDGNYYESLRLTVPDVAAAEKQASIIEDLYLEIIESRTGKPRTGCRIPHTGNVPGVPEDRKISEIRGKSFAGPPQPGRSTEDSQGNPPFPFRLTVENTTSCNIECIHCLRRRGGYYPGSMNPGMFEKICRSAEYGLKEIRLSVTGEPLASATIREEIAQIEKNRLRLSLFTNGLLLRDKDLLDRIFPLLDRITFSVDSASPRLYERIRRGASFANLEKSLSAFAAKQSGARRKTRPVTTMALVLMKSNFPGLAKWVEFGSAFGIDILEVSRLAVHLPAMKEEAVETADPAVAAAMEAASGRAAKLGIEFFPPPAENQRSTPSGACPFIRREAWIDIRGMSDWPLQPTMPVAGKSGSIRACHLLRPHITI